MARHFQFGIGMLLALTAVVAMAVWALGTKPSVGAILAAMTLTPGLAAISIVGFLNTRGYARAFWIGAAAPSILACAIVPFAICFAWVVGGPDMDLSDDDYLKVFNGCRAVLAVHWANMPILGLGCVGFRWLLVRGGGSKRESEE